MPVRTEGQPRPVVRFLMPDQGTGEPGKAGYPKGKPRRKDEGDAVSRGNTGVIRPDGNTIEQNKKIGESKKRTHRILKESSDR